MNDVSLPNRTVGELVVDGVSLEFTWVHPTRDKRLALVLLHEGLGCVSMWRDFPEKLAVATGCGVLVYSRQGYGGSDPVPLPRPVSYMHDEAFGALHGVLEQAAIGQAVLVGHSDGASIAAIHAGGLGDKRIRGLVLMAPHFFVEDCSIESIEIARDAYEQGDLRTRLVRHHGDNVDCAFKGWNGAWLNPDFREWNIEEYLPDIEVPVLVIQGEDDEYGTKAQADAVEAKCGSGAEVLMLPDCGHSPQRDQSEATLDAIAAFVARISSAPEGARLADA